MDISDYNDETIDYIYGNLSEEETAAFEEKLKADPVLAEEVSRTKEMIENVKIGALFEKVNNDPGLEWADQEAKMLVREHKRDKRREYLLSKKFRRKVILPAAAVILGLLYFGNTAFLIINPDLAFEKYYKDYTPEYYAQATVNEAQELLRQSMDEYKKGNYHDVAENMRNLMEQGKLKPGGAFLLGFYDAWIELTGTIFGENFDPEYTDQEDAAWYLALSSFKLKDFATAQTFLKKISSKNNRTGKNAARLERKIGQILSTK